MADVLAVYTAITNGYDQLSDKQHPCQAKFVAFTDSNTKSKLWEIRPCCQEYKDPNRNAKKHKILSHEYLPDVEYSLWIDGTVHLLTSANYLVRHYLKEADLVVFKHPTRDCLYAEAQVCQDKNLDDPAVIQQQVDRYKAAGYPENNGLVEATIILRRHNESVKKFNELWWQEIQNGSRRDQISFNYVAKQTGIKLGYFDGYLTRRKMLTRYFSKRNHIGVREWADTSTPTP